MRSITDVDATPLSPQTSPSLPAQGRSLPASRTRRRLPIMAATTSAALAAMLALAPAASAAPSTSPSPAATAASGSAAAGASGTNSSTAASASGSATSSAAPSDPQKYIVELLSQYREWWQAPGKPYNGTGTPGKVTERGVPVLTHNDNTIVNINLELSANAQQLARAVKDADTEYEPEKALPDGLGPILGQYFAQGVEQGKLRTVVEVLSGSVASTSLAKSTFQNPRPFVQRDTWLPDSDHRTDGKNELSVNGSSIPATLPVKTQPDGTIGSDGQPHKTQMEWLYTSGSFPSGHTTEAYGFSIPLAVMLPELAPEILVRASEMANNRIVLGVHYPLDLMGGRIAGTVNAVDYATKNQEKVTAARTELRNYLAERCQADNLADTLEACMDAVGAKNDRGYTNPATDTIATIPVTDRTSALAVYRARMTYGFDALPADQAAPADPAQAEAGFGAVVPMLKLVYPELSDDQLAAVVRGTAIESGYPLSATAQGWDRINLARALSQKVTVSQDGTVVGVQDADAPTVEHGEAPSDSSTPADEGAAGDGGDAGASGAGGSETGASGTTSGKGNASSAAGTSTTAAAGEKSLATTGSPAVTILAISVAVATLGGLLLAIRRSQA